MSADPDKLSRFWQELKRRKVIKAMAMYAATAFIVIEAGDIVLPRLGLPDWTVTFLIVLVIAGFPIALILSWIFDVSPKGFERTVTESVGVPEGIVPVKQKRKLKPGDAIIAILLAAVCILLYPKLFHQDKFDAYRDEQGRISLAVMPFENQTGDTTLNYFQRGISSYLSNDLGGSPQLSVKDEQSIFELTTELGKANYAGFIPSNEQKLAQVLKAETYLTGSFQGRNGNYQILVDLIDSHSGDKIWTGRIQGNLETSEYFDMADSLCRKIKDYLEIRAMKKYVDADIREAYTQSAVAYRYYVEGMNSLLLRHQEHAVQALSKALDIDPDFTLARFYIAWAYGDNGQIDSSALWTRRAWETRENLPVFYRNWLELWHACFVGKKITEVRESCTRLQQTETDSRFFWYDLGLTQLLYLQDYDHAVRSFQKVEEISEERGGPWKYSPYYRYYTMALHEAGNHGKEKEINTLGQRLFPTPGIIMFNDAVCAASRADWNHLAAIMEQVHRAWDERGTEAKIREYWTGLIFDNAGMPDSALVHHRRSYSLDPDDPYRRRGLARVLIEYDYDVEEGMELLQSITDTTLNSDSFYCYHLGWAYLKLGQAEKALPLLVKAKDLLPNANKEYDDRIREAEQALARANNGAERQ